MENHKSTVTYRTLKSNLINLPSNLANLLFTANIQVQDVIIELVPTDSASSLLSTTSSASRNMKAQRRFYAGWSGMTSSAPLTIEIDPIFAQSLQIKDKTSVILNLKLGNYETAQINLEPLTSSDWEVVELNAQLIEDKLLNQTRCVALGQVLVVYPNATTSAKLVVTEIGSNDDAKNTGSASVHKYAKISPYCEIAIAPKLRGKKDSLGNSVTETRSVSSAKSSAKRKEDYSNFQPILKRGISLPHGMFQDVNHASGCKMYLDLDQLPDDFDTFVAVSVVPGPNEIRNNLENENDIKENRRVIAQLVDYKEGHGNVGLSFDLATALGVRGQIGNIIALKPAIKNLSKRPSSFVVHPYVIHTNKKKEINLTKTSKTAQMLNDALYPLIADSPVTNYMRIPAITGILPYGGLLKFRKIENHNAWIKPYNLTTKKPVKIEIGDELLRPQSFVEEVKLPYQIGRVKGEKRGGFEDKDENGEEEIEGEEPIGVADKIEDLVESFVISENTGTLVYGNAGSGKTLYLKEISHKLSNQHGYFVKYVSCDTLMNETFQNLSKNHMSKWFQQCSWNQPSLLVLDNIDKILNVEMENMDASKSNQITEYLVSQMSKLHQQKNSNVSILCSAVAKESVNKLLLGSHLIESYFHVTAPDKHMRFAILEKQLVDHFHCKIDMDLMDLVSETEGYLPNDLKTLAHRVYHQCLSSSSLLSSSLSGQGNEEESINVIRLEHATKALSGYTPSGLRGVKLQTSETTWSDIGGLSEAKKVLLETLEWPTKYAPIFANCPLRLRSGILLYGYPGCGKTLLASAIAGQCGLNFISIKGPEILNKYIGASEQSVRELFERAQAAKPCILFFDEFDSIAPKRGHDSTGVTDRVVNQMLTQMDGAEGLDGVYVLAATSRPDLIDSALLRPGRLDKSVLCDMPDYEDRLDILRTITAKMDLEEDVNLEEIAKKTAGFSGADMQGLGYNAYLKAVHVRLEALEREENKSQEEGSNDDDSSIEFFKVGSEKSDSNGHSNTKNKMKSGERLKILHQIEQFMTNEKQEGKASGNSTMMKKKKADQPKVMITHRNFAESLEETKPSISQSEKTKLTRIYSQFVDGRDGKMPDGAPSNEIGGRTTLM